MKKRFYTTAAILTAVLFIFTGCEKKNETHGPSGNYAFGGSTTVMPVVEAAIEDFSELYPDVRISYDAQGSSVGIKGVLQGTYSLGGASRELKPAEIEDGVKATAIALDGVAVVVNKKSVNITNLSREDLTKIYSGEIDNWITVGGPDAEIVVFNRDEASGTRSCFKDATVKKYKADFKKDAAIVTSNGDMVSKVGSTPYSIGYCGFGYIEKNPGTRGLSINGTAPETENVINKRYPISRPLNIVYTNELSGVEKLFLDFLLSDDGQSIAEEEKFIPLK